MPPSNTTSMLSSRIGLPARSWATITPSDTVILNPPPRSLRVKIAGDVQLEGEDGIVETFPVALNEVLPCSPKRVKTGTTATLIALY